MFPICPGRGKYIVTEVSMSEQKRLKIVVFSDSHGSPAGMLRAARLHEASADMFIHLGDGLSDIARLRAMTDKPIITVSGNCDGMYMSVSGDKAPPACTIDAHGITLFICHGHTLGVKYSLDALKTEARARGADIALFGHTHVPLQRYIPKEEDGEGATSKPLYLFNPGSASQPRGGSPSYGLIEYRESGNRRDILLSHGSIL